MLTQLMNRTQFCARVFVVWHVPCVCVFLSGEFGLTADSIFCHTQLSTLALKQTNSLHPFQNNFFYQSNYEKYPTQNSI